MEKKVLFPCIFLSMGLALSLYRSANDYGLKTINLSEAITAQADGTSGGSGNSSSGTYVIVDNHYLESVSTTEPCISNAQGVATSKSGVTVGSLKPNTRYTFYLIKYTCEYKARNICMDGRQGTFIEKFMEGGDVSGGDTSGGTTSGGDSTNGDRTN